MNNSGYNPIRRNRNIGSPQAGRGHNNRLVIPTSWRDNRLFYEKLVKPVKVCIKIASATLNIFVEPTLSGFVHACTIDDIINVLQLIPISHFEGIKSIILRQPKRKEKLLSPVWGRLVYWSSTNDYSGAAIYIEAQEVNCSLKWSKSLTPEYAKELKRLENDGHLITSDRRYYTIKHTIEAIRNTQLYRTLPHEIGHYVDYLQTVEQPSGDDFDLWNSLNKLYANKPQHDKEAFAHCYADKFRALHLRSGQLPFARIFDEHQMISMDLMPEWFLCSTEI